jgi:hypothetical protein
MQFLWTPWVTVFVQLYKSRKHCIADEADYSEGNKHFNYDFLHMCPYIRNPETLLLDHMCSKISYTCM